MNHSYHLIFKINKTRRTLFPITPEQGRFASKKWYFDKALSDRY
jgi:hypothetical protein